MNTDNKHTDTSSSSDPVDDSNLLDADVTEEMDEKTKYFYKAVDDLVERRDDKALDLKAIEKRYMDSIDDNCLDLGVIALNEMDLVLSQESYLRSVEDRKIEELKKVIIIKEMRQRSCARYERMIEMIIDEYVDKHILTDRGIDITLDILETVPEPDGNTLMKVNVRSGFTRNSLQLEMPYGFYSSGLTGEDSLFLPFNNTTNKPKDFLLLISVVLSFRLEQAGFIIEKNSVSNRTMVMNIAWADGFFLEAMERFQYDSEVEAYEEGVPLADLLV